MNFDQTLIEGKLIKRYKRFLADVELDSGEVVTAHTPNTGSMRSCIGERWPVRLSESDNPKRKLKYTFEMSHNGTTWIGLHTHRANDIAEEAIKSGRILELSEFEEIKREVKYLNSRIDILLQNKGQKIYVEVKNVTLKTEDDFCEFPDAKSDRGLKHLVELQEMVKQGHRACMFYVVQREDVEQFRPCASVDPKYAAELIKARQNGVEVIAYQFKVTPESIELKKQLPVILK